MNIREIISYSKSLLINQENSLLEVQLIISKVIKKDKLYLMLNLDRELLEEEQKLILKYIEKRNQKYPLQYILGEREFWSMDFYVEEGVLIPRNDTEILVEQVLKRIISMKNKNQVEGLEIGIGSGIISISLLCELPFLKITAVDINKKAIKLSQKNAIKHNIYDRLNLLESNLFDNIAEAKKFDFIVSNPPYIKTDVIETLQEDIKNHEPRVALDGGKNGLVFYEEIIKKSKKYLKEEGFIAFEIGFDQANEVKTLLLDNKYSNITVIKDLAGLDRVVIGTNI